MVALVGQAPSHEELSQDLLASCRVLLLELLVLARGVNLNTVCVLSRVYLYCHCFFRLLVSVLSLTDLVLLLLLILDLILTLRILDSLLVMVMVGLLDLVLCLGLRLLTLSPLYTLRLDLHQSIHDQCGRQVDGARPYFVALFSFLLSRPTLALVLRFSHFDTAARQ